MITKTDAAERQLNTAIRLFFENRDHLSSYTLAAASCEVTDDVTHNQRSKIYQRELARVGDPLKVTLSHREEIKLRVKPEFHKDFFKLVHKWRNFLKHADTDPNEEIEPLKTRHLAVVIIFAIKNYVLLTQHWTTEMRTFFAWLAVAEPQLVNSESEDEMNNKVIAELRSSISVDPYDRNTLEAIYIYMTEV